MVVAVGVLPYPVTFICTDLISELYGRKRATEVVWVGLLLNVWVVFLLWIGGALPGFEAIDPATGDLVPDEAGRVPVFFEIRTLAFGAVTASMIAYLFAQWCDVQLFHFWKWLTNGRHLWLRNNGSTLVSQLVDTVSVILITHFWAKALPIDENAPLVGQLVTFHRIGLRLQTDRRPWSTPGRSTDWWRICGRFSAFAKARRSGPAASPCKSRSRRISGVSRPPAVRTAPRYRDRGRPMRSRVTTRCVTPSSSTYAATLSLTSLGPPTMAQSSGSSDRPRRSPLDAISRTLSWSCSRTRATSAASSETNTVRITGTSGGGATPASAQAAAWRS